MNKKLVIVSGLLVVAGVAVFILFRGQPATAGPYGGDLVPIDNGTAYAEVLTNEDTNEVMTHVWEPDLKTPRPIENKPMTIGSEEHHLELGPHPTAEDPAGRCSRFYGRADWVRGGAVRHGWLQRPGDSGDRMEFSWQRCWKGGRAHVSMWSEMEQHRRMGMRGRQSGPTGSGRHDRSGGDPGHHHEGTDIRSQRLGSRQGKKNDR